MSSIRSSILSIVAVLACSLLPMGLVGIYQISRRAKEAEEQLHRLTEVVALVDATRSAQHHFKIQFQEWKDVLIHGGEAAQAAAALQGLAQQLHGMMRLVKT